LVKTFKSSDDLSIKQGALYFLKILTDVSDQVAAECAKYGATQAVIDDLRKNTRGVNILANYLVDLLDFMSKICKHNQGHAEFLSPMALSSLVLCLQSDKIENKIFSMNCVMYLARTKENITILANYDTFNLIITNLMRAYE